MVYNIKFYIISLSHVKDNAAPLFCVIGGVKPLLTSLGT